ncbi:MAG: hypothetical protein ACXVCM_21930, partial [Ktedonobacteraceae bacterium]
MKNVKSFWEKCKKHFVGYEVSFIMISIIMPLIASIATAAIYLKLVGWPRLLPAGETSSLVEWSSIVYGLILTLLIWLILAFVLRSFTTAKRAESRQYDMLASRLGVLEKHIKFIEQQPKQLTADEQDAFEKVKFCKNYVRDTLYSSCPNLGWITGQEFVNLWKVIHHAQEAEIYFMPLDRVIQEALHDKWSIVESAMSNEERDELFQKIECAVRTLDPSAIRYFCEKDKEESLKQLYKDLELKSRQTFAKNQLTAQGSHNSFFKRMAEHISHLGNYKAASRFTSPMEVILLVKEVDILNTKEERDA